MGNRLALAVVMAVVLTGCSGGAEQEAAPEPTLTTITPSEEPTPVVVGLATTCETFFGDLQDDDLAQRVLSAATPGQLAAEDLPKYEGLAEEVRQISALSEPYLRPPLDAQAQLLEAYVDDIRKQRGRVHDTEAFRAAGVELAEHCRAHLGALPAE